MSCCRSRISSVPTVGVGSGRDGAVGVGVDGGGGVSVGVDEGEGIGADVDEGEGVGVDVGDGGESSGVEQFEMIKVANTKTTARTCFADIAFSWWVRPYPPGGGSGHTQKPP